jgi:hypothetical protein
MLDENLKKNEKTKDANPKAISGKPIFVVEFDICICV